MDEEDETFDIVFTGDVTFRGIIEYHVRKHHCTYNRSFEEIKKVFDRDADEVVVNFESVVGYDKELKNKQNSDKLVVFHSNPQSLEALKLVVLMIDLSLLTLKYEDK